MVDGRPGLTEGIREKGTGRGLQGGELAHLRLDMNPQHKEAVENSNAIFSSINSTAECARREAVIPACASRSGHTQFYAQSCRLCFKRGIGKGKPVQMSMRIGRWPLDRATVSLTILSQLTISEWLCTRSMMLREPGPGIMFLVFTSSSLGGRYSYKGTIITQSTSNVI